MQIPTLRAFSTLRPVLVAALKTDCQVFTPETSPQEVFCAMPAAVVENKFEPADGMVTAWVVGVITRQPA